jgi:hypothetical protein
VRDKRKILRIAIIVILVIVMIYIGFKRERYLLVFDSDTFLTFIRKYPRLAPTDYKKEMGGVLGFSLSPKLVSAVLYSIFYTFITSLIIHLSFLKKKYTKITALLFAIYIVVCFLLIQLGNFGVDYNLSVGLSHYLEDLFLSPFPLMLLIPVFMIGDRMGKITSK